MTMHRIFLLTVLFSAVLAQSDEYRKKCRKLEHPDSLHCCKLELPQLDIDPDTLIECIETAHTPQSCERDICLGKKRGYVSDDGTVDKEALEEMVNKVFSIFPILTAVIKEKCIHGDVENYGPPNLCLLVKTKRCIRKQFLLECTEWDSSGNVACDNLRELVKQCTAISN